MINMVQRLPEHLRKLKVIEHIDLHFLIGSEIFSNPLIACLDNIYKIVTVVKWVFWETFIRFDFRSINRHWIAWQGVEGDVFHVVWVVFRPIYVVVINQFFSKSRISRLLHHLSDFRIYCWRCWQFGL